MQTISEAHLLPVIRQMLEQFPTLILGFHADNGSEYVNHQVAKMLDKLRIEFTRSRPRRSNDNGLVETKNDARATQVMQHSLSRLRERAGVRAGAQALRLIIDPHPCPLPEGEGVESKNSHTLKSTKRSAYAIAQRRQLDQRLGRCFEEQKPLGL